MVTPFGRMHFIGLKRYQILCIIPVDSFPYLLPMVMQFLKSPSMEIHNKLGISCFFINIGPHGMAGNAAEIQMFFRYGKCIFKAAESVRYSAMIM